MKKNYKIVIKPAEKAENRNMKYEEFDIPYMDEDFSDNQTD